MTGRLQCNRVNSPTSFMDLRARLARGLLRAHPYDRGEVHAQKVTHPTMITKELMNVNLMFGVPMLPSYWAEIIQPNLPWAEDHFQERISGHPHNPPPSHEYWPYNRQANAEHLVDGQFSHTYPERFWPQYAGVSKGLWGIRFRYGDLNDLVHILMRNPRTRQAYLPVWFPEDLAAAYQGERVPCTLGYHFLMSSDARLHMTYYLRSCDFMRFWQDDIYMAGRLLQWVQNKLITEDMMVGMGDLIVNISSLHAFTGDEAMLKQWAGVKEIQEVQLPADDDEDDWSAMVQG